MAKKYEYTVKLKRAKADHAKASKELTRLDSMMMDAIDPLVIWRMVMHGL